MQVQKLIDEFADAGIWLTAENGQVVFEGPREVLTSERIEELRRHKEELLAALAAPNPDAFRERAGIIHEAHTITRADDGAMLPEPIFALTQEQAEALAAQEQGYDDATSLHRDLVEHWAAEIDRLARLPAVGPEGAEALKRARAFISEGWAIQIALGQSKKTSARTSMLSRGAAFGGVVGSSKAVCSAKRAPPSSIES